jgi:hypothetical protein
MNGTSLKELGGFQQVFVPSFWHAVNSQSITSIDRDTQAAIVKQLHASLASRHYSPSPPLKYIDYDKGFGVVRRVPVFSPRDYCVYFYCLTQIEEYITSPVVPNTFGGWSLNGAIKGREDESENALAAYDVYGTSLAYNPVAWPRYYGDFNAKLFQRIRYAEEHSNLETVAEFDIANFYDSIRLPVLERKLRSIVPLEKSEIVDLLMHFLSYWNRDINGFNPQTTGIPQDALADCSRILANFYLADYDLYVSNLCAGLGATYFRYADDQLIFVASPQEAKEMLRKCSLNLSQIGLNVNQKKVKLWTLGGLKQYRSFEVFDLLCEQADLENSTKINVFCDALFGLNKEQAKDRGYPLIKKFLKVDLNRLSIDRRTKFLALCFDNDFLECAAKEYDMWRIYRQLYPQEQTAFRQQLELLSQHNNFLGFQQEVYLFFKHAKLNTSSVIDRIATLQMQRY